MSAVTVRSCGSRACCARRSASAVSRVGDGREPFLSSRFADSRNLCQDSCRTGRDWIVKRKSGTTMTSSHAVAARVRTRRAARAPVSGASACGRGQRGAALLGERVNASGSRTARSARFFRSELDPASLRPLMNTL